MNQKAQQPGTINFALQFILELIFACEMRSRSEVTFLLYMQSQGFLHHLLKSPTFLHPVDFVKINYLDRRGLIPGLCSVLLIYLSVLTPKAALS